MDWSQLTGQRLAAVNLLKILWLHKLAGRTHFNASCTRKTVLPPQNVGDALPCEQVGRLGEFGIIIWNGMDVAAPLGELLAYFNPGGENYLAQQRRVLPASMYRGDIF